MKILQPILRTFETTPLENIEKIRLANRIEEKYVIHRKQLPELLKDLAPNYLILKINDDLVMHYDNDYLDTDDFLTYHLHQNGKLNRFKVRRRTYKNTDTSFIELKMKNNRRRVIKKRAKLDPGESLNSERLRAFVENNIDMSSSKFRKTINLHYFRILLVNRELTERITIDLDLHFTNNKAVTKHFPELVIIEVKQDRLHRSSRIYRVLEKRQIKPFRISKYCLGIYSLYDSVKKNQMKRKIASLEKKLR